MVAIISCFPLDSSHKSSTNHTNHFFEVFMYLTSRPSGCNVTDNYGSVSCSAYQRNTTCLRHLLRWYADVSQQICPTCVKSSQGPSSCPAGHLAWGPLEEYQQYQIQTECFGHIRGKDTWVMAVMEDPAVSELPVAKFKIYNETGNFHKVIGCVIDASNQHRPLSLSNILDYILASRGARAY